MGFGQDSLRELLTMNKGDERAVIRKKEVIYLYPNEMRLLKTQFHIQKGNFLV